MFLLSLQGGVSFAVAIVAGALTRIHCQRGVSLVVALAGRARRQGLAPRREQVQVDDVCVPGTWLELGQKASCVSQL
jgi:hypothetical protein